MANVAFTRDEIILALDAYYQSNGKNFGIKSERLSELCSLLQSLPIHSQTKKNSSFRTPQGVRHQLYAFSSSFKSGEKNQNVGDLFFEVAFEYEDRHDELHKIALAIKNNIPFFESTFGNDNESFDFPEGNLLGHLHRIIECRDSKGLQIGDRCSICGLKPEALYLPCGQLLELHLAVNPSDMVGNRQYQQENFITVCPNCHAALHKIRPWISKGDIQTILK